MNENRTDESPELQADDVQAVEKLAAARDRMIAELRKAIVGMDRVIDEVLRPYPALRSRIGPNLSETAFFVDRENSQAGSTR